MSSTAPMAQIARTVVVGFEFSLYILILQKVDQSWLFFSVSKLKENLTELHIIVRTPSSALKYAK